MPSRDPIEALRKYLAQSQNRNKPKRQIEQQCRFFWGLLKANQEQCSLAQLTAATQAALTTLGATWNQLEHEMFLCILLDGGHMTLDRDMYPHAESAI